MKKLILLAPVLFLFGCTSSGPVTGLSSYAVYKVNQGHGAQRASIASIMKMDAPVEKKLLAVQAINAGGGRDNELAAGIGLVITPGAATDFSFTEIASQTAFSLVDVAGWVALGKWGYDKYLKQDTAAASNPTTTTPTSTTPSTGNGSPVFQVNNTGPGSVHIEYTAN